MNKLLVATCQRGDPVCTCTCVGRLVPILILMDRADVAGGWDNQTFLLKRGSQYPLSAATVMSICLEVSASSKFKP